MLASGVLDSFPALPPACCVFLHKPPKKWLLQPDCGHLVKSSTWELYSPPFHCGLCSHETSASHRGRQSRAPAVTAQKTPLGKFLKLGMATMDLNLRPQIHEHFKPTLQSYSFPALWHSLVLFPFSCPCTSSRAIPCQIGLVDRFGLKLMQQKRFLPAQTRCPFWLPPGYTLVLPSGDVYASK